MLQRHGIPCWFSEHGLAGAARWQIEIGRALARCHWFVLILSEHSSKSDWVQREYCYALDEERYRDRVVPIVIGSYDKVTFWAVRGVQHIELTKRSPAAMRKLLKIWGLEHDGLPFAAGVAARRPRSNRLARATRRRGSAR